MARVYVPKNIDVQGVLITHEPPSAITELLELAKLKGNEFITLTVTNGTARGHEIKIKRSLVQAYE